MFNKTRKKIKRKWDIWVCTDTSIDAFRKEDNSVPQDRGITLGEAYIGYKVYEHYKGKK